MAKLLSNLGWIKQAWRADPRQVDDIALSTQYATMADYSFSDTLPGGSPCMNPPPQSCRNADIRTGIGGGRSRPGIGRAYFENIEATGQYIHIRAGVTKYNSLGNFYTSAYDPDLAQLSLTGRVTRALVGLLTTAISVAIGIAIWPIMAVGYLVNFIDAMAMRPKTKYAYLHPTMLNTWRRTNIIAYQLAVNDRFITQVFEPNSDGAQMVGDAAEYTDVQRQYMHRFFPDLFNSSGDLDVYATFTRWHRNNNARQKKVEQHADILLKSYAAVASLSLFGVAYTAAGVAGIVGYNAIKSDNPYLHNENPRRSPTLNNYQDRWLSLKENNPVATVSTKTGNPNGDGTMSGDIGTSRSGAEDVVAIPMYSDDPNSEEAQESKSWWGNFISFFGAELDDGGAFMTFRVSETGASSMSLNNQTGESALKSKMDSLTETSRSSIFNVAGGNLGDGLVANTIETVLGIGKTVVSKIGSELGFTISGALAGGANIDIPLRYISSNSSLPTMSYTIELHATYNNPYCRMVQLWIPLAALIAVSHPQQSGAQSYSPPPVVEVYDRGHAQTRYGIVESISISVGEGSQSHNLEWKPSSIKVTLNIRDLSTVMYAPISQGFSFDIKRILFDEDTAFTDYLAAISGVEMYRQIYFWQKVKANITKYIAKVDSFTNPAHFGAMLSDFTAFHVFDFLLPSHDIR